MYYFCMLLMLTSASTFCADSVDQSNGTVTINHGMSPESLIKLSTILQLIDEQKNITDKQRYLDDALRNPIATALLLKIIAVKGPDNIALAIELFNLLPQHETIKRAAMAGSIGEMYLKKGIIHNAMLWLTKSLEISPISAAMVNAGGIHEQNNDNRGSLYWFRKAKKEGYQFDDRATQIIKYRYQIINTEPDQKTDFKKDLKKILKWETEDLYNPEILLEREDI